MLRFHSYVKTNFPRVKLPAFPPKQVKWLPVAVDKRKRDLQTYFDGFLRHEEVCLRPLSQIVFNPSPTYSHDLPRLCSLKKTRISQDSFIVLKQMMRNILDRQEIGILHTLYLLASYLVHPSRLKRKCHAHDSYTLDLAVL